MKTFNKLVRDKIPEIIKNQGETPLYTVLEDKEYRKELDKKLLEEVNEYEESKEIEELADILEVVYALCEANGHTLEELHKIREDKYKARGGFQKKYYLKSKE